MSIIIDDSAAVDTEEFDRLVASTVQAMRQALGATVAELAKASGVSRPSLEAIERGGGSTRSERHDIAVAVEWLSNHRVAKNRSTEPAEAPHVER